MISQKGEAHESLAGRNSLTHHLPRVRGYACGWQTFFLSRVKFEIFPDPGARDTAFAALSRSPCSRAADTDLTHAHAGGGVCAPLHLDLTISVSSNLHISWNTIFLFHLIPNLCNYRSHCLLVGCIKPGCRLDLAFAFSLPNWAHARPAFCLLVFYLVQDRQDTDAVHSGRMRQMSRGVVGQRRGESWHSLFYDLATKGTFLNSLWPLPVSGPSSHWCRACFPLLSTTALIILWWLFHCCWSGLSQGLVL